MTLLGDSEHLIHPKYRADIDGLRAIAVLSIVFFHAFPHALGGGFIGVDIFFVISGFLISTIIFSSLQQNRFSLIDFYSRRIKRIFPALILVLTACYLFGWFALLAPEYTQLGKHIAGGASFISNFIFLKESGYFDNSADTKPLLHLWSLAVEEQFYIVWPLILWLAWKQRINMLTIIIVVAIISFALNVGNVQHRTARVFFSPQTRFWELLAGSALAHASLCQQNIFLMLKHKFHLWFGSTIHTQVPAKINHALTNVQSILGTLMILIGVIAVNKGRIFPGWWALLPVVGSMLVISAGMQAWINHKVLSSRILVWFGLISFPLYLWHWPLLAFARIMEEKTPSGVIRLIAVLISIILAWLTYLFIERPIRKGKHGKVLAAVLLLIMTLIGAVGYHSMYNKGFVDRYRLLEKRSASFEWPEHMNHTADCISKFGPEYSQYCLIDDIRKSPEILLIGDSNANHLYLGLNIATKGKNLLNLGRGACLPFLGVSTRLAQGEVHCESVMTETLSYAITTDSIKTVVLSMQGPAYINNQQTLSEGSIGLHSLDDLNQMDTKVIFESGMRKTLQLLINANKTIVFVISIPRLDFSPMACVDVRPLRITHKSIKLSCRFNREVFDKDSQEYRKLVFSVLKDFPKVRVFDAASELCDDSVCWAIKDGKILYRDELHLSVQGSKYLAQKMIKAIPSLAE